MTSIIQDIQYIRSLKSDIREVKVPSSTLKSIGIIHDCIKGGTDTGGWKKVDWRGGSSKPNNSSHRTGYSSYSGNNNNYNYNHRGNYRDRDDKNTNQTSHNAFGSKNKQCNTGCGESTTTDTWETHKDSVNSDGFRPAHPKYVSKFKKNTENVDDTILNTILLGKLNKFSELNYDEIKEFITHIIDSGQTDMIKCFMKLVFEKAASEEMFCPLYAKLLSELSSKYPVLLTEMATLYTEYMEIFDDVHETGTDNYNEVCKRNVEKKYRRGYSQFLAELIKYEVININTFMKTVNKILSQVELKSKSADAIKLNEEYADCLMKIMKAIQKSDATDETYNDDSMIIVIRQSLKGDTLERIKVLGVRNPVNNGISNKSRFTFLDIYEGILKF